MPRVTISLSAIAFTLLVLHARAIAHPGEGIVTDPEGNVYLADAERNIIWKVTSQGEVQPLARNLHSHSIGRDALGRLYAEHLKYLEANPADHQWETTLVQISKDGAITTIVNPTTARQDFGGSPFTADPDGHVVSLARTAQGERRLVRSAPNSIQRARSAAPQAPALREISGITARAAGGYYVTQDMNLLHIDMDGSVALVADLSHRPMPSDSMSLKVGNLWGLDEAPSGDVYIADWDARTVHKVDPTSGAHAVLTRSEPDWAPTGIAAEKQDLFIMECGLRDGRNLGPRVVVLDTHGNRRVLAEVRDDSSRSAP